MSLLSSALGVCCLLILSVSPCPGLSPSSSLRVGMSLEPPGLDPTVGSSGAIDEIVYANVFEGLTRIGEDGNVKPGLAERWEMLEEGRAYLFYLREGVRFHDGTKCDAEDVKFSLDRARAVDSVNGRKRVFLHIDSVGIVSPLVVRVGLSGPNVLFPYEMGLGDAVIVGQETAARNTHHPVGTGPFRFVDWEKGRRVILERNPDYWGEEARLDRVEFRFIGDPFAGFVALLAGDLDLFPRFPAPELLPYFEGQDRFSVTIGTTAGEVIVAMNNGRKPFDDARVREAVSRAIDRDLVIAGAMFGHGIAIGTHFPPGDPFYGDFRDISSYDPEMSRGLLSSAGFAEGLDVTLMLPPLVYARRAGEIVAAQLRAVGIRAHMVNMDWGEWLGRVFHGKDFDLTIVGHTEAMDLEIYADPSYYFHYDSKEFADMMLAVRQTSDARQRKLWLLRAQERIARDYVNVYLFQLARTGVMDARLEGVWVDAPIQANDLTAVYWRDPSLDQIRPTEEAAR